MNVTGNTPKKKCELVHEKHIVNCPILPAIDIHTHWGRLLLGEDYESIYDTSEVVSRLKEYGLKAVVNLDCEYGDYFDRMIKKTEGFEDYIITFGNVDLTRFAERSFDEYVYSLIKRQVSLGMRGLKFWKSLGLSLKDDDGRYLRVDDRRLSIIWQTAAEFNLPVLIHIADPTAFLNQLILIMKGERNYRFILIGHFTEIISTNLKNSWKCRRR